MTLEELRERIDDIDQRLFELLQERLKVVGDVGKLKKSNGSGKYIIRAGREAVKVNKAFRQAIEAGYDKKTATAFASLWREIISLSINYEEVAKIAYNSTDPENVWKLREYIGPYTEKQAYNSDAEVFASLESGKANIASFTVQKKYDDEPWWLKISKNSELSVFASAPVFKSPSKTLTLVVSKVAAEPSGEDKFLYVVSDKIPADEVDSFEVISQYKNYSLVSIDEFYNNYQSKLKAKYIGCYAVFEF